MSARSKPQPQKPEPAAKAHNSRDRAKTHEELEYAMLRVKNKGLKMSISAVAREAGVSPGLIHNTYQDIRQKIYDAMGKSHRQERDEKVAELEDARKALRELREQLDEANADIKRLASINETLREELSTLKAAAGGKVTILSPRNNR